MVYGGLMLIRSPVLGMVHSGLMLIRLPVLGMVHGGLMLIRYQRIKDYPDPDPIPAA
jgi:hypothetical protein